MWQLLWRCDYRWPFNICVHVVLVEAPLVYGGSQLELMRSGQIWVAVITVAFTEPFCAKHKCGYCIRLQDPEIHIRPSHMACHLPDIPNNDSFGNNLKNHIHDGMHSPICSGPFNPTFGDVYIPETQHQHAWCWTTVSTSNRKTIKITFSTWGLICTSAIPQYVELGGILRHFEVDINAWYLSPSFSYLGLIAKYFRGI